MVLIMFSAMRERIAFADVPVHFRGAPIGLITAGLMALAFMGFQRIWRNSDMLIGCSLNHGPGRAIRAGTGLGIEKVPW